jgi:hypothetical protein
MVEHLRRSWELVQRQLARHYDFADDLEHDQWLAITQEARTLANKRKSRLPHDGRRQATADRARATAVVVGLGLGDATALAQIEHDGPLVERLLGIDRGRTYRPQGTEPWLSSPPGEGLAEFARFGNVAALIAALEAASSSDLETARANAKTLVRGLASFAHMADLLAGTTNVTGMAAIIGLAAEPAVAIWIVALLLSLGSSPEHANGVEAVINAIQTSIPPVHTSWNELVDAYRADPRAIIANVDKLPAKDRARARRLVAHLRRLDGAR